MKLTYRLTRKDGIGNDHRLIRGSDTCKPLGKLGQALVSKPTETVEKLVLAAALMR